MHSGMSGSGKGPFGALNCAARLMTESGLLNPEELKSASR